MRKYNKFNLKLNRIQMSFISSKYNLMLTHCLSQMWVEKEGFAGIFKCPGGVQNSELDAKNVSIALGLQHYCTASLIVPHQVCKCKLMKPLSGKNKLLNLMTFFTLVELNRSWTSNFSFYYFITSTIKHWWLLPSYLQMSKCSFFWRWC